MTDSRPLNYPSILEDLPSQVRQVTRILVVRSTTIDIGPGSLETSGSVSGLLSPVPSRGRLTTGTKEDVTWNVHPTDTL